MLANLTKLTDEELIAEFQRDNEQAFTVLVGKYKDPLTNFVFRFMGDWNDCDDVVQETFVRVFRNKHSYKPVAKFSTWLYTIATNLAKTQLRKRKLRSLLSLGTNKADDHELVLDIPDEHSKTDSRVEASFKQEHIQRALETLSVKYREVVVMRDVQDLSYEEIAAITGLNLGTVKSRINRARTQLQGLLRDIWND